MDFSIDIFGFDILPNVNVYGFWIGRYENRESEIKCFYVSIILMVIGE